MDNMTKEDFAELLNRSFNAFRNEVLYKFDGLRDEFKDEFRQRNDTTQKNFDEVMGELQTIREDNTIGTYQIKELRGITENHEKRITALEQS